MKRTERGIRERKASAWRALNNLRMIWTSNLPRVLKTQLFLAAIETILLYSCEAWSLTTALTKSLDGCYAQMLCVVFDISWQQHIANKELHGDLPNVSDEVAAWRLKIAGHCLRHPELPASSLVLWEHSHGRKS